MKLRPRLMGLLAVAAASLAFAMLDRDAQTTDGVPSKQGRTQDKAKAPREAAAAASAPAPQAVDDVTERGEADLFAAKSWHVAPPPPPPPEPEAPPFPYTVTGSMSDGEDITLFLNQGERNFIVKKGDVIGGNYRLDDIADGRAEFTYLPLKERQYLQIGKIN